MTTQSAELSLYIMYVFSLKGLNVNCFIFIILIHNSQCTIHNAQFTIRYQFYYHCALYIIHCAFFHLPIFLLFRSINLLSLVSR